MKIQIDGTNTKNKGAELMLVSILDEINIRYPNSEVFINENSEINSSLFDKYNFKISIRNKFNKFRKFPIVAILRRLKLPYDYFTSYFVYQKADLVLDASGFQYGDQWNISKVGLELRERYYKKLNNQGSKIVFLPQAFGPFKTENAKKSIEIIDKYADVIIAREKVSYEYLQSLSIIPSKLFKFTDFTLKTKGIVPDNYTHLKGYVCIIPNKKMITHGNTSQGNYMLFLRNCVNYLDSKGKKIFLLNHEGEEDYKLCLEIKNYFDSKINLPIVSGLKAKEIKGVIGLSSLVISSRFHGVASSLSQSVPCLATSWNHKYEMLFKDFNQFDNVFNYDDDWSNNKEKLQKALETLDETKIVLRKSKDDLLIQINKMWDMVFRLI